MVKRCLIESKRVSMDRLYENRHVGKKREVKQTIGLYFR